jgi:hypothetical protein
MKLKMSEPGGRSHSGWWLKSARTFKSARRAFDAARIWLRGSISAYVAGSTRLSSSAPAESLLANKKTYGHNSTCTSVRNLFDDVRDGPS